MSIHDFKKANERIKAQLISRHGNEAKDYEKVTNKSKNEHQEHYFARFNKETGMYDKCSLYGAKNKNQKTKEIEKLGIWDLKDYDKEKKKVKKR